MKQRTGNLLFTEIANEMTEFNPDIDKKTLSISFKGDFWVNQRFYKQQYVKEGTVALSSNLDFIPPDFKDENVRRNLYQRITGCSLDSLFLRAQAGVANKIERMEIGNTELWEGSVLQRHFSEFYLHALRQMLDARFCMDLLLGNEVIIGSYNLRVRYTDDSRLITSIVGAYQLAEIYDQLEIYYSDIMQASRDSLMHSSQREILQRMQERADLPKNFLELR